MKKIKDLLLVIGRLIPYQVLLTDYYLCKPEKMVALVTDIHQKNSKELRTFPSHCLEDTTESCIIDELKPYSNKTLNYQKNCTNVMETDEFRRDLKEMASDLKRILITGCCTDICVLNAALSLINFVNEHNYDIDIVVPKLLVETYQIEKVHDRDRFSQMAFDLMKQAGIETKLPMDIQKVLKP